MNTKNNDCIRGLSGSFTIQTVFCLVGLVAVAATAGQPAANAALPPAEPNQVGLDPGKLTEIDQVVAQGLKAEKMPGCVVLVARRGQVAFLKSYGYKRLRPEPVPMRTDTVFDMASITKPVATATSVMILLNRGLIKLDDPVAKHVP
ncbi:MAG: serine hydrolase domain-containing protein, partial [Planctomycetota bacterium]